MVFVRVAKVPRVWDWKGGGGRPDGIGARLLPSHLLRPVPIAIPAYVSASQPGPQELLGDVPREPAESSDRW